MPVGHFQARKSYFDGKIDPLYMLFLAFNRKMCCLIYWLPHSGFIRIGVVAGSYLDAGVRPQTRLHLWASPVNHENFFPLN